jgi:hypothetical protein
MDLSDKHPAEIQIHNLVDQLKQLLKDYNNQYISNSERNNINHSISDLHKKILDIQLERIKQYIDENGKLNLPKEEENLQREITGLMTTLSDLVNKKSP